MEYTIVYEVEHRKVPLKLRRRVAIPAILIGALLVSTPISAEESELISIIQLIVTPEKFDGKRVAVMGFLRLEFEGTAIYIHQDDYEHGIVKNGVWVSPLNGMCEKPKNLDQKYVLLEGRFDANKNGHMGLFSGSIVEITRCKSWFSSPKKTPN